MQQKSRIRRQLPTGLMAAVVILVLSAAVIVGWKQWQNCQAAASAADATSMLMHGVFINDPAIIRQAAYCSGVKLQPQNASLGLVIAVIEGHRDAAEELLRCGAWVDWRTVEGRTPLLIAAGIPDDADIAEILLDHGADPGVTDQFGATPLTEAQKSGNIVLVKLLMAEQRGRNS